MSFRKQLEPYKVFSLANIRLYAPECTSVQLNRWVTKGYLTRIIKGFYMFADMSIGDKELFLIANTIYEPSYVSCESALSYYNLIPEAVYQTTSVTSRHTYQFDTPMGEFSYTTVKPVLLFGYNLVEYDTHNIRMASPEKALLDFLYKYQHIRTIEDIEELRLNHDELARTIHIETFTTYMNVFPTASFKKRASILLDYLHANIS